MVRRLPARGYPGSRTACNCTSGGCSRMDSSGKQHSRQHQRCRGQAPTHRPGSRHRVPRGETHPAAPAYPPPPTPSGLQPIRANQRKGLAPAWVGAGFFFSNQNGFPNSWKSRTLEHTAVRWREWLKNSVRKSGRKMAERSHDRHFLPTKKGAFRLPNSFTLKVLERGIEPPRDIIPLDP